MKKRFGLLVLVLALCVMGAASADNTGHECVWGEWVSNNDKTHTRTCTTDPTHTETKDCSQYFCAMVDASGHNILCECMYVLGKEPHTMDEWAVDGDVEQRECETNCDYFETRPIDTHTHSWGEWTNNGDGTHTRVCQTESIHSESGSCEEFKWIYDDKVHVKQWVCGVCGSTVDLEYALNNGSAHVYTNATDLTCDVCGYTRTVEGTLSITGSMPAATVGEAYSASFGYSGTVSGVVFWNATGLPDGFSINAGSGVVSGTPAAAGKYSVTIAMGATGGGSASKDFTLTVNAPAHVCSYSAATCTIPATCTDPACGATTGSVDKTNHTGGTEILNAVDAGEFTEGYTGDTHCKGCGDKLEDGETIPAKHTHSYDSYDYDSDDHWKVCSCGATTSAEDHDWYIYKTTDTKHYRRCNCGYDNWADVHSDKNKTGKCDACGYEMEHVCQYTYSACEYDETKHIGVCACKNLISASHADRNEDLMCDVCGQAMPEAKVHKKVQVEFNPGDGVTLPADAQLVVADLTVPNTSFMFTISKTWYSLATREEADRLRSAGLAIGKTYYVDVLGAYDIDLIRAGDVDGDLTLIIEIPEPYEKSSKVLFVAWHVRSSIKDLYIQLDKDEREDPLNWYKQSAGNEWMNPWDLYLSGKDIDIGAVSISADGKTLQALHNIYSFSPFIVYAFVEADEPEIETPTSDSAATAEDEAASAITHTVVSGENLTVIARKYGCTVDEIVALNSDLIENPSLISVGWVLTIPVK